MWASALPCKRPDDQRRYGRERGGRTSGVGGPRYSIRYPAALISITSALHSLLLSGPGVTSARRSPTTIGGKYRASSKAGRGSPSPANFESRVCAPFVAQIWVARKARPAADDRIRTGAVSERRHYRQRSPAHEVPSSTRVRARPSGRRAATASG
jgi:hypothetical protein